MLIFGRQVWVFPAISCLLSCWCTFGEPAVAQVAGTNLLLGDIRLHDPSGFMELDGYLLVFATGRPMKSAYLPPDQKKWVRGPPVFAGANTPAWHDQVIPDNKGVWAPHAALPGVLYYSIANDDEGRDIGAIGRATAVGEPPNLTWVDDGAPVLVCDRDVLEEPFAIDPAVFVGKHNTLWLAYGSHWSGIHIVQLDPETGQIKDARAREEGWSQDNKAFYRVASELGKHNDKPIPEPGFSAGQIEAPYVYWDGQDDYYLFVNWGRCCSGVESTYEIRVGRSKHPGGPYLDRDGHDMAEGGGTMFLQTQGRFIGPGHANIWTYTDTQGAPRHVFSYHFYDGRDPERPGTAKMHARELVFNKQGWPVLSDDVFYQRQ